MVVAESSITTTLQVQVTNTAGIRRKSVIIPVRNKLSSLLRLFTVQTSAANARPRCISVSGRRRTVVNDKSPDQWRLQRLLIKIQCWWHYESNRDEQFWDTVLETSNKALNASSLDKASFDHLREVFGLLTILQTIASEYRFAEFHMFKKLKIHFFMYMVRKTLVHLRSWL